MDHQSLLANLSPDQVAVIKNFEHELAKKFGNPVILVAFNPKS